MNYEEFEQAILADPNTTDPECLARAEGCARSAALWQEVRKLDQQLASALQVNVPESLLGAVPDMAAREQAEVAQDNVVSLGAKRLAREGRGFGLPVWIGLAASVALVAGLVLRQPAGTEDTGHAIVADISGENPLVSEILAVVSHFPEAMQLVETPVPSARLTSVLGPAGADLNEMPGIVSFARTCVVNGKPVPHLVIQSERGPVTLILLPGEMVDGPLSITHNGLEGVILPVGEDGAIAILGNDQASVDAVREQAMSGVRFTI